MPVTSAGLLLYRFTDRGLEVFIAHLGGPFWANKDAGAWSIPKGEHLPTEDPLVAAKREFLEEIGTPAPDVDYVKLGDFRISSGKVNTVFVGDTDFVVPTIVSNTFELEWPPRSGIIREFPEVDDAGWFGLEAGRVKVSKGQVQVLDALGRYVAGLTAG